MAEDKKDLKPEEQSGPAVSGNPAPRKEEPPAQEVKTSAPVQEAEKADTPAPADKSRPGNVIDISGAMIDKIVAEKEKAAKAEQEQARINRKKRNRRNRRYVPRRTRPPRKPKSPKLKKCPRPSRRQKRQLRRRTAPAGKNRRPSWNRSFGRNTGFPRLTNPWSPLLSRKWNRL